MDRTGAVRDEQRDVRDFSRFARLGDEAHASAESGANEMVVNR